MQRITVTVDDDVVDVARQMVKEGRAPSLSAWVSAAMREKALARIQLELELDELRETDPYTRETIESVASVLDLDPDQLEEFLATPIRPRRSTGA